MAKFTKSIAMALLVAGLSFSILLFADSVTEELSQEISQIEGLLEEKKEKLAEKRSQYRKARVSLKEAAKTGFLGFWRSQEEIQKLLDAKDKTESINREYKDAAREMSRLRRQLRELERERALQERRN